MRWIIYYWLLGETGHEGHVADAEHALLDDRAIGLLVHLQQFLVVPAHRDDEPSARLREEVV
jgi:hypothetical protein